MAGILLAEAKYWINIINNVQMLRFPNQIENYIFSSLMLYISISLCTLSLQYFNLSKKNVQLHCTLHIILLRYNWIRSLCCLSLFPTLLYRQKTIEKCSKKCGWQSGKCTKAKEKSKPEKVVLYLILSI